MQTFIATSTRFPLGDIVITANARSIITHTAISDGLARHAAGDWGDLCPEDAEQNIEALDHGGRLFSAYGNDDQRFWIVTECDRSVTTILMPSDY